MSTPSRPGWSLEAPFDLGDALADVLGAIEQLPIIAAEDGMPARCAEALTQVHAGASRVLARIADNLTQ